MSRKILDLGPAGFCSQMDSPKSGTGSGRDRCTAAVGALIDVIEKLGPKAKAAQTPADTEAIMFDLVDWLNPGQTWLPLEDMGVWFPRWLKRYGYDQLISLSNIHNPTWANVKEVIDRQQIAIVGVNDYRYLTTYNGGNPFAWNPFKENAAGHVLLLAGYDDNSQASGQTVIVNDPLRGYDGQPWDYSWSGLQKSGFADLTEIVGKKLPYAVNSDTAPAAPPDPAQLLAAWQAWGADVVKALALLASLSKPPA